MVKGKIDSKQLVTFLPKNLSYRFHFCAKRRPFGSFLRHDGYSSLTCRLIYENSRTFIESRENSHQFLRSWLTLPRERGLIPFLTEFGGSQEAEQVGEYLNLHYAQIEAHLLNATIWNYDLYNTKEGKDNWNLENFSLLGPNRTPRNLDVVARPYPMCRSAEPVLLFFDIESKYATIILKGKVVEAPTVIYIPFNIHYAPEFTVWATSKQIKWDKDNQSSILVSSKGTNSKSDNNW